MTTSDGPSAVATSSIDRTWMRPHGSTSPRAAVEAHRNLVGILDPPLGVAQLGLDKALADQVVDCIRGAMSAPHGGHGPWGAQC
jgi:hypothetical protein